MLVIEPDNTPALDLYQFLIGAVAPRPIALVSTLDTEGNPNLAPYSFFNAVSAKPPMLVFSTSRRIADKTDKDTLYNVQATKECVVNVVSYDIVRQMTLAAVNYPKGISEFTKSGLTPIAADLVKPFRVKESPVHMECKVEQIIPLGTEGGAGHLVLCRVVRIHINERILDENKKRIDPHKIDLVGRMGRFNYARAHGAAIFEIEQPERPLVVGYDALPASIRNSEILSGNNIAQIAGLIELPTEDEIFSIRNDINIQKILFSDNILRGLHMLAQEALHKGDTVKGAKIALLGEYMKKAL
jgi:flavin reductase (DIM6/NTAB) family NADH-FMN oxidoreductase RutF